MYLHQLVLRVTFNLGHWPWQTGSGLHPRYTWREHSVM